MKAKHAIALLIFGYCLDFIATFFKITHRPGADTSFGLATILKVVGALILLYKITNYPKFKDFIDS
jgi:hypothetical protein